LQRLGFTKTSLLGLLWLTTSLACGSGEPSNGSSAMVVCAPTAASECLEPAPRYSDVAPIFARRCASCHTGRAGAPWPLDSYAHVADWSSFIRDELLQCSMPPRDSGVAMTADERDQILIWLRCGAPE